MIKIRFYAQYWIIPVFVSLFILLCAPSQAAIPRILYVGDSWTYYPWAEQDPPALRSVLLRSDIATAIGGEYTEVGDIALHGATAEQWDSDSLKAEITQKLSEYPTIDIVHISLGGNDVNLNWRASFTQEQTDALMAATVTHIQNVVQHCLSVRPNIRVAICGYDYLNLAEGYTWGTWTNPYTLETIVYVKSIENPTMLAMALYGFDVKIFNPDYPLLGWTTAQEIAAYQARMDEVFINLERRKKDMALGIDRVTYIHSFGAMQSFFGIPSMSIAPNTGILPQGRAQGYANFPAGYSNMWSPREAMSGSSELDPIHLNPEGYIHLMEGAVWQAYFSWLSDSTPPSVSSVALASANPPTGAAVDFAVTFSENVTGVDTGDFAVDAKGTVSGASILGVSGSGSVYTVTVSTPTGDGSLSIDVVDNNSIYDGVWAPLGGMGDDSFIYGEWYTIGTGSGGGGDVSEACPILPQIDAQGGTLYPVLLGDFWENGDFDANGMFDSWEVAVLAKVLCDPSHPLHNDLQSAYSVTLNALRSELYYDSLLAPAENLLVCLLLLDSSMCSAVKEGLDDVLTKPYVPFTINVLGAWVEPFGPTADLDADGDNNRAEYDWVTGLPAPAATRDNYVTAVLTPKCPEGIGPDVQFAQSLQYLYELQINIPLADPICLICEDPMTADLDQNRIVDYAHALLADALLWCTNTPHYQEVATAYAINNIAAKACLDRLWEGLSQKYWSLPVEQGIGLLVDLDKVEHALTGLITLGEPAGVAMMKALFDEANTYLNPDDQIEVNPGDFDLSAVSIIGSLGDADDDGVCNLSEYNAAGHDLAGFAAFAANALNAASTANGGGCDAEESNNGEEPAQCPILAQIDAEGAALYAIIAPSEGWNAADYDGNGMTDSWEAALLADVLCDPGFPHYQEARKKYTGNLQRLLADDQYSLVQNYVHVLAALMTVSSSFSEKMTKGLQLSGFYYPYREPPVTGEQVLSGGGDPDSDTLTNKIEYMQVRNAGGTREEYVLAAKTPLGGGNVDRCPGQCAPSGGRCTEVDFDGLMRAVEARIAQLGFQDQLGGYSFDPGSADINGGFNAATQQIYSNGILDSDEFALINFYLTQGGLGAAGQEVCSGWNHNVSQMYADLGGSTGLVNALAPELHQVLAAYMLLGDDQSVAIPVTAMTAAANASGIDLGVTIPNLANYTRLPQLLAYNSDPDGDNVSNIEEYLCFRMRSRCCYLLGATSADWFPAPGQCIDLGEEGEGTPEGITEGEGTAEGEGAPEVEEGEGETNPCAIMACPLDCAFPEGIDAGFEAALRAIYANSLVNKNPGTADLDENGIIDAVHARLVDAVLADAADINYCCIRTAYEHNRNMAEAYADAVQAAQPVLFVLIPRVDVVAAMAGLMTLGESATIAILTDALESLPVGLPTIDLDGFDRSSEQYLAFNGDADLDGVCNLGEYTASVNGPQDFDGFITAARNAAITTDGGGCPPCGGEGAIEGEGRPEGMPEGGPEGGSEGIPEGGAEGEPEGGVEGSIEGAPEGQSGGEGTGEGEGAEPVCLRYAAEDLPLPIADTAKTASAIVIPDTFEITDVNVVLDITHTAIGNLIIWLDSPGGTRTFLMSRQGEDADNLPGTTFDDQAATAIFDAVPPYAGTYQPNQPLSAFNGENAQGAWKLAVYDYVTGDTGTLNAWQLVFNNSCGTAPEGEGLAEGETESPWHSADTNHNWSISLTELLRVIQFFNMLGYHVQAGTEDGYGPGPGSKVGIPHDSDYAPRDWIVNLGELLRLIQFFNTPGGYLPASGTEDGFAPKNS